MLVATSEARDIFMTVNECNLSDQCTVEASSRLQRCQILRKELEKLQRKTLSSSSQSKAVAAFERPGVMKYKVGYVQMVKSALPGTRKYDNTRVV